MPKIPYSQRKDGRYYKQIIIGVDEQGKRIVKTLYDRDWRELDKKVRQLQLEVDNGRCVVKDVTFGECAKAWLNSKTDISEASVLVYKSHIKKLFPLHHMVISQIKPSQVESVYNTFCKEEMGYGTGQMLKATLNQVFDFAVRRQYVTFNIMDRVAFPKIKENKRRALTERERECLKKAHDLFTEREKCIVDLALYCGMRRNEILALKRSDVDLNKKIISVCSTLTKSKDGKTIDKGRPKTSTGNRKIPIINMIYEDIVSYINTLPKDQEILFLSKHNRYIPSSSFGDIWDSILSKVNSCSDDEEIIHFTAHQLRHTYATDIVYAGVNIKTVQYLMGHKKIDTTLNIYAETRFNAAKVTQQIDNYFAQ